jgi:hypothetical protein
MYCSQILDSCAQYNAARSSMVSFLNCINIILLHVHVQVASVHLLQTRHSTWCLQQRHVHFVLFVASNLIYAKIHSFAHESHCSASKGCIPSAVDRSTSKCRKHRETGVLNILCFSHEYVCISEVCSAVTVAMYACAQRTGSCWPLELHYYCSVLMSVRGVAT